MRALTFLVALGALTAGCGGGGDAFRPTFPDNRADALSEVSARLTANSGPAPRAVAVALTEDALVAYDVEGGRQLWSQPVSEPRTAPHVAGELVVIHEGDRIVARRLSDGRRAFEVGDDRLSLVGAAGEGDIAAISLSTTGGGVGAESRLLIVRGGGVSARIDAETSLGEPAVRNGLVIVPWGNQNVSVIDGDTAAEVARLRSMAGVVGHATVQDGTLYFGQAGIGRWGANVDAGNAESVGWVQPPTEQLPGAPPLWRSAYDPPAGPRSATHKIRVAFAPTGSDGPVGFTDDSLYLTFYRLVFALAPQDLSVRWVHQHPSDVVGAAARPGGVVIADAAGRLTFLGTDGQPRWEADMGVEPTVVAMRLGGFAPSGAAEGEPASLGDQLLAAAQNTDARLVPARAFAVTRLAALEDPEITRHLIVLCDDRSMPDALRLASCEALATRDSGGDAVLAALERHAAFLDGTTAPPVGPLAAVAARLGERRAVPLLLAHLNDPATAADDLPRIAAALAELGDQGAADPMRDFLWLYHAEATDEGLARGVAAVAAALMRLAGPPGRDDVQEIIEAPFTAPAARGLMAEALQRAAQAEATEEDDAEDAPSDDDE